MPHERVERKAGFGDIHGTVPLVEPSCSPGSTPEATSPPRAERERQASIGMILVRDAKQRDCQQSAAFDDSKGDAMRAIKVGANFALGLRANKAYWELGGDRLLERDHSRQVSDRKLSYKWGISGSAHWLHNVS
jgi:hypothetical protein